MEAVSKRVAKAESKFCAACGACARECPKNAVYVYKGCYAVVNPEICIGCGRCTKVCPVGCIATINREE